MPAETGQLTRELPAVAAALSGMHSDATQQLKAEVERVRAAIPASAEALSQELTGGVLPNATEGLRQLAQQGRASTQQALSQWLPPARPATDVIGEDPPDVERIPGFVRTAFARDGERLRVSWAGAAPHTDVLDFYTQQLGAAGYRPQVRQSGTESGVIEFASAQRSLTLAVRSDGRGGSELDWEVR